MTTILENLRTRVEELRSRVEERRAKIRETLGLGSSPCPCPGILGGETKLLEDIRERVRARVEEVRARVRELGVGGRGRVSVPLEAGTPSPKKVKEKDTVKVSKGRTVRVRFI